MNLVENDGIPELVEGRLSGLLYGRCPACGRRFWSGLFRVVAYSMHYATEHLGIPVFRRPT